MPVKIKVGKAPWPWRKLTKLFKKSRSSASEGGVRGNYPKVEFEIIPVKTKGEILEQSPRQIDGKGIFTKKLETALIKGAIGFAVHSMKNSPGGSSG